MPKPDHEIIKAVLADALTEADAYALKPRPGTLNVPPDSTCAIATEAWAAFSQLDGPGWLQNAHTPEILHGDGPALTAQLNAVPADQRWPVAGERACSDGKTSLHLRRTSKGWVITRLEEADSTSGLLLTKPLLSIDLKQYLVYHVAYRLKRIGGHDELRPFASRFVHFAPVPEYSGQPAGAAKTSVS